MADVIADVDYLTPIRQWKNPVTGSDLNFDAIAATIQSHLQLEIPDRTVSHTTEDGAYDLTDMLHVIQDAIVVMCDITSRDANCMYQIGYAHGIGKAVLMVGESDSEDFGHIASERRQRWS